MDNLTGSERRRALEAVGRLALRRVKRAYYEEEIAHKLGFGNPEAVRIQLRDWELPGWLALGKRNTRAQRERRQ
jgi:hypothetical protein